jgi:predicted metal-binding protein
MRRQVEAKIPSGVNAQSDRQGNRCEGSCRNFAEARPHIPRFLETVKIMKIASNAAVIRFNTIKTQDNVGRYSNSTRFFPAGKRTPVCHSFTRRTGCFLPFTRTFQAGVNHSFKTSSEGEWDLTTE